MWSHSVSLCLLLVTVVIAIEPSIPKRNEADLQRNLFRYYEKLVRPVNDPNVQISVSFGMTPLSINQVDVENQVLVLDTYIKMKWKDAYLKWNPIYYLNTTVLMLPSSEVWTPDLAVYTTTPDSSLFPPTQTRVVVYSDGTVVWVPMFTIRSRCPMARISTRIQCEIKIGSWAYSEKLLYVDLASEEVPLDNFINNNHDWKLQKAVSRRESKIYPCCPDAYSTLYFNFTILLSSFLEV